MIFKQLSKIFLYAIFIAFLLSGYSSCSRRGTAQQNADGIASDSSVQTGLKIAIVTSPNVARDGAFNENNYNGIRAFIENNPESTVALVHDADGARAIEAVRIAAAGDFDVIVTPGFQFSRIAQTARENPDKKFILMDTFPSDESGTVEVENILAIQFREQDGGFLAGIAAALETKTNRIASIGGMSTNPANINYQIGFEAGVHYANRHLGTNASLVSIPSYARLDANGVNMGGAYVGSFNDASLCRLLTDSLINEGADIIFVFAGNASQGSFAAAIERDGVLIIGAGTDQADLGLGDRKFVVLTTIMKAMGLNVERALVSIADGSFTGGNQRLGIDTDSIVYIDTPGRHQLSSGTINHLEAIKHLLKNSTIIPPSMSSGNPNDFIGF